MGINKVDQKTVSYRLLWFLIKFYHHIIFYRKVEIINEDLVPKNGAIIFTPNHQNALMDALAVLFSVKRTLVFLARADIFKKKVFAEILYFLRILPVFRPRDGQGEVKKNLETFEKTTEVLMKNLGLVIFPEGTHTDKQSLLPLKKGFAKIAFQTEEASNFSLNIQLIPMAISYTDYERCQEVLSVNYGEPIPLNEYFESYKEFPAKALNEIKDRVSDALKNIMIHLEDDEYYDNNNYLVRGFASVLEGEKKHRILAGRAMVDRLSQLKEKRPEDYLQLQQLAGNLLQQTQKFTSRQQFRLIRYSFTGFVFQLLRFVVLSVLILPSMALQVIHYVIADLPNKKIKDHQFYSSFRFVLGLLSKIILFYPMYLIVHSFWPGLNLWTFFLLDLFTLLFITWQLNWLRNFAADFKIFIFNIRNKKHFNQLHIDIKKIRQMLRTV